MKPPHWKESSGSEKDTKSVWGKKNQSIEVQIGFSDLQASSKKGAESAPTKDTLARKLTASVQRISIERPSAKQWHTMSRAEHSTCLAIVEQIKSVIRVSGKNANPRSLEVLREAFDDMVVGSLVTSDFNLQFDAGALLRSIKSLAEQTYENSSLSFGCLISPKAKPKATARFPHDFLGAKRFRSLSDGFATAYHIGGNGALKEFLSLNECTYHEGLTGHHYYPLWAEDLAACTRGGRCGIALTRHGDILIFKEGSLLWTYRFGRWQMWNHAALSQLLTNLLRGQKTPLQTSAKLARAVYRASLDAAFRRRGALFVVLEARTHLKSVAAQDDHIDRRPAGSTEAVFDGALGDLVLQAMPRPTLAELASLDGAVITDRGGRVLSYGAVMRPRKKGRIKGTEGSRTKAAIGASNYGTAVKVSSDGQISIYFEGEEFLRLG
ncbi:MAG: hypothetical protein U1F60_09935 [Planctomycetota bacterium]